MCIRQRCPEILNGSKVMRKFTGRMKRYMNVIFMGDYCGKYYFLKIASDILKDNIKIRIRRFVL